jgi:hypothetical protein
LQSYAFWLFDVAPIDSFGLPLFTPLFGFSRITSPEVTATIRHIKEGNWHYTRKVISGATVSPITMERGVFWADSDFWRWLQAGIWGDPEVQDFLGGSANFSGVPGPSPRRDLMLIQFFPRGPFNSKTANDVAGAVGLGVFGAIGAGLSFNAQISSPASVDAVAATAQQVVGAVGGFGLNVALNPQTSAVRIPAKAWLLNGCIPTRYKASSDFDAATSAVSLQELDIEYERFEEIGLFA